MLYENDGPMDDYAAADAMRIELETCRCPRDMNGYPSPDVVNDLCEAHGQAIWRAIDDGRFWSEPWPWGEPLPARRGPAGGATPRREATR